MLQAKNNEKSRAWGAEDLFRAHGSFVAAFLARMGVATADLDDAVQEVFLIVHRKGGYQPGPAQPRSWLAAIAVRIAQSHRRQRLRLRSVRSDDQADATTCAQPDPAMQLETRNALAMVQAALDQLPLELRAAFVLYEIERESCESIAATWDVPVGTVYSRLHNARKRFLQAYAAHAQQETGTAGITAGPHTQTVGR